MEEVIVIGAGPAGAHAACELAWRGIRVRLLERSVRPRSKLCAGGLPPKVIGALGADVRQVVERSCDRIRFQFDGRWPFELTWVRPVVHVVRRERLDALLIEQAVRAGARLERGTRVLGVEPGPGGVLVETGTGRLRALAAVAADGARGAGARMLGRVGVRSWPAIQVLVRPAPAVLEGWASRLGCDFGCPAGGIGWVFPRSDHLAVGVCADRKGVNLGAALGRLLSVFGLADQPLDRPRFHPIPVWDGRRVFRNGAVLVAGDAAGLANPLTGAGIRRACLSGRLAAESIAAYLAGGARDPDDLAAYERRLRAELLGELARARLFARLFYRAPGLCYRAGVLNARVNPWVEQLLSGQKDYRDVFGELISGAWLRAGR